MVSTKRLTEEEIDARLAGRPIALVRGTFKNIKSPAQWQCLNNPIHGIFSAPPRQIIHAHGNCPKCGKVSKLTEELVKERLGRRPIELINGTLKGSNVHAKWKCLQDPLHPLWESSPASVLISKSGCPVCSGKLPLNEEEIQKRLEDREIALLQGSYIHEKRTATWQCLVNPSHANWTTNVGSVLYQNTGCPECAGNIPLTEEIVKQRLGGRPLELIQGSLLGAKGKSQWRCLTNFEHPIWVSTADSVLGGANCPACTGHEKLDVNVINRKIKNRPINLISKIIEGSDKKVIWGCLADSQHANWEAQVSSVLGGSGCPECGGNARLSEDKINKRLGGRFITIKKGTFKSSADYATWHCLAGKNHSDWNAVVSSILGGVGCPDCAAYGYKETKPAYIYILILGELDNPIGIKCGITNNEPKFRHQQINRKTLATVTLVREWYHESGKFIRELESLIISNFKHNNLGGLLQDGATETYYYNDFDLMVKFIENHIN